jgi:hypothetical protein
MRESFSSKKHVFCYMGAKIAHEASSIAGLFYFLKPLGGVYESTLEIP